MLLRHTLLYLPAQLLAPLAQFVAAVVWTHWMSPQTYGVLTFIVAAQDLVFVVCLSWWSAFCLRYFASFDRDERGDYKRSETAVLALTIVLGALTSLALLAWLGVLWDYELVIVTIVFLVSRSVDVHFAERARAQQRILDYTIAQVAGPVVGLAIAYATVRWLDPSPAAALGGFAIAQTVAALWLRRRLGIDLSLRRPDGAMVRRALSYGVPMVIGGALGWVSLNGVRFVAQGFGGEAAMGLLAVGWALGQRLASVTAMLVTAAAFPLAVRRLATHSREEALRQFGAGGTLLAALVIPSTVGLWQISGTLVHLLIAEPYRETTLAILPAAVAAGAVRNLRVHYADQCFLLFEKTREGVFIHLAEAAFVMALSTIGYEWFGVVGAVQGCLVASALVAVATFVGAHVWFGLPLPAADWGRIALASAVMCFALEALRRMGMPGGDIGRLAIEIFAGGAVYAGASAILFPLRARDVVKKLLASAPQAVSARR